MERKSLLYRPSGAAASTAPSHVNAPSSSFGGSQGLADLGQGLASVGATIQQDHDRKQRVQEELAYRKQQDTRLYANASSFDARAAAQAQVDEAAKRFADGGDLSSIDEDAIVPAVSKTYDSELAKGLTKRKVDLSYLSSDEYKTTLGDHRQRTLAQAHELTAEIKSAKRIGAQSLENTTSLEEFRRTLDPSSALSAIANTMSLHGVSAESRNSLLRAQRESVEVLLPSVVKSWPAEQKAVLRQQLVGLGWTAERAEALTTTPKLDGASVSRLTSNARTAATNGDRASAITALTQLKDQIPEADFEYTRIEVGARALMSDITSSITTPTQDSPLRSLSSLTALADKLSKDATGYSVVQGELEKQALPGVEQNTLRSFQSALTDTVKARVALLQNSPQAAVEADPLVRKAADEFSVVIQRILSFEPGMEVDGKIAPDSSAPDGDRTFMLYADAFRAAHNGAATSMGVPTSRTMPVPQSLTDPILRQLTNTQTAPKAVGLFRTLINLGNSTGTGSDVGRSLSAGIIQRAWQHDSEEVRRLAPLLAVVQSASLNVGVNTQPIVDRLLASSLDTEATARARKSLVTIQLPSDFAKKQVSPDKLVSGALMASGPGTDIDDSIVNILNGVFDSYASQQTPDNYAASFAEQFSSAGMPQATKAAFSSFFSDWVVTDAAKKGTVLTEKAILSSASALSELLLSSGLVTVNKDGASVLAIHNVTDPSIYSIFGTTQPDRVTDLNEIQAAAQAVADIDGLLADRAGIDYVLSSGAIQPQPGQPGPAPKASGYVTLGLNITQGGAPVTIDNAPGIEPISRAAAQARNIWNKFNDTNFTFLFTGNHLLGDLDMEANHYPQHVLKELGFAIDVSTVKLPENIKSAPSFYANSRWFYNMDGSMTRHWVTGETRVLGGKASAPGDWKGAAVTDHADRPITVPRANVEAAMSYIRLQGTRNQESFENKTEAEAYNYYAFDIDAMGLGGSASSYRLLKPGVTAPTKASMEVDFARFLLQNAANRSAKNGTNHTRSTSSGNARPSSSPQPER
jgi:hypothetical protein